MSLTAFATASRGGGTTTYFGYDPQGNVTTLTDSSGAVVGSYNYDAWGNLLASSGTRAAENPYRFATKESLSGLYFFGFRFYNAGTGRWINRDPLREDGGANLYVGMGNDPINSWDDYGLAPNYNKVLPEAKTALMELRKAIPGWRVMQAYRPPGTNSGLTHDVQNGKGNCGGSVAFDLRARDHSSKEILNMLQALPKHGFIGWYRPWYTKGGKKNFHIHIVYAFAAEQHSGKFGHFAGDQVDAWMKGKDGLVSNSPYSYKGKYDTDKGVNPWTTEDVEKIREKHQELNPVNG